MPATKTKADLENGATGAEIEETLPAMGYLAEAIARMKSLDEQLKDIPRPTTLVGKLALISALISRVPKRGRNTFHQYNYVQERDLVDMVRPLLAYYGIWVHQTLFADADQGIIAHERRSQSRKSKDGTETGPIVETLTILTIAYQFIDGETGERTEPQLFPGYGDDPSDKGASKASTNASKYFLMRSFLVATGDDPEADTRTDERAAARGRAPEVRRSTQQGGKAQPRHGGRQQMTSTPQLKALGELLRSAGLAKSSAKTLTYFEEQLGRPFPLVDDDPAATLQDALTSKITPEEMGQLIAGLRIATEEAQDDSGDKPASDSDDTVLASLAEEAEDAGEAY